MSFKHVFKVMAKLQLFNRTFALTFVADRKRDDEAVGLRIHRLPPASRARLDELLISAGQPWPSDQEPEYVRRSPQLVRATAMAGVAVRRIPNSTWRQVALGAKPGPSRFAPSAIDGLGWGCRGEVHLSG